MSVDKRTLLAWHGCLLSEAGTIAYRLTDDREVSRIFLEDLSFSLCALAERVKREINKEQSDTE